MDRIIAANSVNLAGADGPPAAGVAQYATDGNPGLGIPATRWPAYQYNAIQEELIGVILDAGLAPNKALNTQLLLALKTRFRLRLLADANFYVNAATGNNANDGLTAGTAWASPSYAYSVIQKSYDLNGRNAIINIADGAYGAINISGPVVGATGVSSVTLKAASAAVTYTTINMFSNAWVTVDGGTITGGAFGFIAQDFSWLGYKNCIFGTASQHHMNASLNGRITCLGNYSITGSAGAHIATTTGVVDVSSATITLTGTPNFSNAFAFASGGVIYSANNLVFAGGATGARYSSTVNGIIQTGGGGASYFPGSASGITLSGGQYA